MNRKKRLARGASGDRGKPRQVALPEIRPRGGDTLEAALAARRSVRRFGPAELSLEALGRLLWAAQGVTAADGGRTAPSAGALYPLELFVVAGRVAGLPPGVYRYAVAEHALVPHLSGDHLRALAQAALDQGAVRDAPAVLVIGAVRARTAAKYGRRATRYVDMEAGHAAQNVCLQATSLGLGSVVVGAFEDAAVSDVLELPDEVAPLALLPVGAAA